MRLTRRGQTVAGVAVLAFLLALGFGARALDAIAIPALVALGAAYLQLRFQREISVVRDTPGDDYAGQHSIVDLCFTTPDGDPIDRPFVGRVEERVGEGISVVPREESREADDLPAYSVDESESGDRAVFETAVGLQDLAYCVRYDKRGERTFGPVTVTARDVFGLYEEEMQLRGTQSVLVYPRVYHLSAWGRESLRRLQEFGRSRQREEFEELREYSPGDPLRDIHWKTTAKRDSLVVKEFAAETEAETVTLAAGASLNGADRMAEAVASVSLALSEDGIPVEVSTVRGTVEVGPDGSGTRQLLRTLALATAGQIPDDEADVVIHADETRATVTVGDQQYDFADLVDRQTPASTPASEPEEAAA